VVLVNPVVGEARNRQRIELAEGTTAAFALAKQSSDLNVSPKNAGTAVRLSRAYSETRSA
jgi:hypothetical protein